MSWISDIVDATNPSSVMDMGCGAGILLKLLKQRNNSLKLNGIDAAENLIRIGSKILQQNLIIGDYCVDSPDSEYDLIVCEFGYDNSSFPESTKPHSSARCGAIDYCPGCVEDEQDHFRKFIKAWRKWAAPNGALALTGRMTDYTAVRAVTLAAKEEGWFVDLSLSKVLTTIDKFDGRQFFPAWYFTTEESRSASNEEIANFYAAGDVTP
ncbi:class I SAM-dependent methyltransferase [Parasphingorhabdus sp.]|uniref:class I SAM-dependent methyltransferase n=1 Tax=Parasphingorhabdus sp. TaxID=2709688 RepID=UPI003003508D